MDNSQEIENTLLRLERSPRSLTIDTLDFLHDVYKASFNLGTRIRQVTTLRITLAAPPDPDIDLQIRWLSTLVEVLKVFTRGRNLERLTLELEGFSRDARTHLGDELSSIHFKSLETFSSISVPHDVLARFIPHHASLTKLDFGKASCKGGCPLQLDALKGLTSITCAASCVSKLVPGKPVFHACVIDGARSSTVKDHKVLLNLFCELRQTTMFQGLTRLDVTFPSTEMDILPLIASAAPHLVHLALVEVIDRCQREQSTRRPWQNAKNWATQLRLIPQLSHLRLKTSQYLPPKRKSIPELWFPSPRTLCETPEYIEIWHHDVRPRPDVRPRHGIRPRPVVPAQINIRHLWSLSEDHVNYAYVAIPGL